ncbi:GNAT family N-acetyltransferase [Heyndrickxia acidicola]|uniref:GNAT family N-acetyltransferase n=1 Tax=Heyndrickxia acidicola TaxID=209389 RepID=A0ABU6MM15_9BACI|nr:GNAT family N-acetyltransferase [Heyndrickxia acidicola]MED1205539.1 GNAT family N-acetyltransferase [Heyndrickxia acidicola]
MLETFMAQDEVLNKAPFLIDEVQYNLIHRISESQNSLSFKSSDGRSILVQTPGFNPWLWISREVKEMEREKQLTLFIEKLNDHFVPGISGAPIVAEAFARSFVSIHQTKSYYISMVMEAYYCPSLSYPSGVEGQVQQANSSHVPAVANFFAGFYKDAFGDPVEPASQIKTAEKLIREGGCFLWTIGDMPVSMAIIAHRSPRHGRINSVYTPDQFRKKGYASALVAHICADLMGEGIIPMLYADIKNPSANKIYKRLGFKESGKIADIRFQ